MIVKAYREPLIYRIKAIVRKTLKSSWIGRKVYPNIQKMWQAYNVPRKRKRLHTYGYEVLARMHEVLTKNNVPYYCYAGTLLGFIRDKGFIKHDDDIDISIMPNTVPLSQVLKVFLDAGYGFVHGFDYEGRMLEFTVMDPANISIDVFMHSPCSDDPKYQDVAFLRWWPDHVYPNEKANSVIRFRFRAPDGLKSYNVHGVEVSIPTNAEEILDSEYGPWRTPDPKFKSDKLKYVELPGYAYRLTKEEALAHK